MRAKIYRNINNARARQLIADDNTRRALLYALASFNPFLIREAVSDK